MIARKTLCAVNEMNGAAEDFSKPTQDAQRLGFLGVSLWHNANARL